MSVLTWAEHTIRSNENIPNVSRNKKKNSRHSCNPGSHHYTTLGCRGGGKLVYSARLHTAVLSSINRCHPDPHEFSRPPTRPNVRLNCASQEEPGASGNSQVHRFISNIQKRHGPEEATYTLRAPTLQECPIPISTIDQTQCLIILHPTAALPLRTPTKHWTATDARLFPANS